MIHIPRGVLPYDEIHVDPTYGDHLCTFGGIRDGVRQSPLIVVCWSMGAGYHSLGHKDRTAYTIDLYRRFKDEVFTAVADAIDKEFRLKRQ